MRAAGSRIKNHPAHQHEVAKVQGGTRQRRVNVGP